MRSTRTGRCTREMSCFTVTGGTTSRSLLSKIRTGFGASTREAAVAAGDEGTGGTSASAGRYSGSRVIIAPIASKASPALSSAIRQKARYRSIDGRSGRGGRQPIEDLQCGAVIGRCIQLARGIDRAGGSGLRKDTGRERDDQDHGSHSETCVRSLWSQRGDRNTSR